MPNEAIPASVWREDAQDLRDNCFFPNTDRLDRLVHACEKLAALREHEEAKPPWGNAPHIKSEWSDRQLQIIGDLLRGPTP